MKQLRIYIILAFSVILSTNCSVAQVSQTQYFLGFPQSNLVNPAFRPAARTYIGLPVLSNTYISVGNNMLNLSEMFQPMPGYDSTITILHPDYNRDAFLDGIGRTGRLNVNASIQLLGVGFTIDDDWYIDLALSQKVSGSAYIPGDLFTFLFEGNESFVGSTIDLSGLGMEFMQYMESSLGVSKNINDKLRVGGRMKLLFGGAGAAIDNKQLEIRVNEDFSHTLVSDLNLNVSGPVDFYTDEDNMIDSLEFRDDIDPFDLLLNSSNKGLAFDFGAEYSLFDNLVLSASIIDLGFIGWKSDVFNLRATNNFSFDGFDVSSVIEGDKEFDTIVDEFADSLKNSFEMVEGSNKFSMGLPTKLFLGAQYRPLDFVGIGLLSRTVFNEGHVSQSLSLSGSLYAGDYLSASLSYTMTNRSYNNFGFGLTARMGPVQFYTVVDQIPASWIMLEDSEGLQLALPERLDYMTLRLGMNLVFGKIRPKVNDKPMLLIE